jgi:haloalkane dehalogenase
MLACLQGSSMGVSPLEIVRTPESRFENLPDYPFTPRYTELRGPEGVALRMHYLDEGDPSAPPILLAHGEPAWSFLYRKLVPRLVEAGLRVVVPDHIGFGRSDKIVEKTAYTFERHVDWLHQFVVALDLQGATLLAQDWGGPIGFGVLAREPDRFARAVAANTMLHTVEPALAGRLAWSNHGVGEADAQVDETLLAWMAHSQRAEVFLASHAAQGATRTTLPDEVLRGYDAPFPDERYKGGMRQFPILIPVTRSDPGAAINRQAWSVLEEFEKPFLTVYGDSDPGTGGWDTIFQERIPGASGQPHQVLANAGHFLQEDVPAELAKALIDFVQSTS